MTQANADTASIKVKIIGAGFSGLTLAYFLLKKGFKVEVFESSSRVGGLIQTTQSRLDLGASGLIESAANGFLGTEKVHSFLKELELNPIAGSKAFKKRFILSLRGLKQWPLKWTETLLFFPLFISVLIQLKFRKKDLFTQEDLSVRDWLKLYFGETIGTVLNHYLVSPAFTGIYGVASDELNAALILKPIFLPKAGRSRRVSAILSLQNGMSEFFTGLLKKLEQNPNFKLHKDFATWKWDPKESESLTVLAVPLSQAQLLLENHPLYGLYLKHLKLAALSSVTVISRLYSGSTSKKDSAEINRSLCINEVSGWPPRKGFGILFTRELKLSSLGVLFNSFIFADRAGTNPSLLSETWIMNYDSTWSDDQILDRVLSDRQKVLENSSHLPAGALDRTSDMKKDVLEFGIHRWPQALPVYDFMLLQACKKIDPLTMAAHSENLLLHGNYLGDIGLSRILERSEKLAERIYEKNHSAH